MGPSLRPPSCSGTPQRFITNETVSELPLSTAAGGKVRPSKGPGLRRSPDGASASGAALVQQVAAPTG